MPAGRARPGRRAGLVPFGGEQVRSADYRVPGFRRRERSRLPTAREFAPPDRRVVWLWFRVAHVTR